MPKQSCQQGWQPKLEFTPSDAINNMMRELQFDMMYHTLTQYMKPAKVK